jgi:hypothetical protein
VGPDLRLAPPFFPKEVEETYTPSDIKALGGGINNQVWSFQNKQGQSFVYKRYLSDGRNRGQREFLAYQHYQALNYTGVPKVLLFSKNFDWIILEHLSGRLGREYHFKPEDVDQLITFMLASPLGDTLGKGPAAEACFSLPNIFINVEERRASIDELRQNFELLSCLKTWDHLWSFWKQEAWNGGEFSCPPSQQWLSASDLGFHNGIKSITGQWKFFDFEYFGKDDPAKTICDVYLHPGMAWTNELRRYFLIKILAATKQPDIAKRVARVFPLHALNWALRVLNPLKKQGDLNEESCLTQIQKAYHYCGLASLEAVECFRQSVNST